MIKGSPKPEKPVIPHEPNTPLKPGEEPIKKPETPTPPPVEPPTMPPKETPETPQKQNIC